MISKDPFQLTPYYDSTNGSKATKLINYYLTTVILFLHSDMTCLSLLFRKEVLCSSSSSISSFV